MKTLKKALKRLWLDESGQGAMEYILILVVIGTLVIAFRKQIVGIIEGRTGEMGDKLKGAIGEL